MRRRLGVHEVWRSLNRRVAAAQSHFDGVCGVLGGRGGPALAPAERAVRIQQVDAALTDRQAAEEKRRLFRQQLGLPERSPAEERAAYGALLRQLHRLPAVAEQADDPLLPLRCGQSAEISLRVLSVSPQVLAVLRQLAHSLPPGALQVHPLRERQSAFSGGWTAR